MTNSCRFLPDRLTFRTPVYTSPFDQRAPRQDHIETTNKRAYSQSEFRGGIEVVIIIGDYHLNRKNGDSPAICSRSFNNPSWDIGIRPPIPEIGQMKRNPIQRKTKKYRPRCTGG